MVPRPPYARTLTRRAATRQLSLLVAFIASIQFILTGLTLLVGVPGIGYLWLVAGVGVAYGTFLFETSKAKRRGERI